MPKKLRAGSLPGLLMGVFGTVDVALGVIWGSGRSKHPDACSGVLSEIPMFEGKHPKYPSIRAWGVPKKLRAEGLAGSVRAPLGRRRRGCCDDGLRRDSSA